MGYQESFLLFLKLHNIITDANSDEIINSLSIDPDISLFDNSDFDGRVSCGRKIPETEYCSFKESLKVGLSEKLDSIADEIYTYSNNLIVIYAIFKSMLFNQYSNTIVISSPYLNFRDALFHYNKMYEAAINENEEIFIMQYACIVEHLDRGIKDFYVFLFNNYTDILHRMLNSADKSINSETLLTLKKIYHAFKNFVVQIRLEKQAVQHLEGTETDNKTVWLNRAIEITGQFKSLLQENIPLNKLYSRCARMARNKH